MIAREYEFELSFSLPANVHDDEDIANRLYEAGCDDALVGLGVYGQVVLEVTREADSAFEAISSVIVQVSKGIQGAKLIEAGPDLVGVSDLAELLGTTRQNLKRYLVDKSRSAEATSKLKVPAHNGTVPTWHLAKIGRWINQNTKLEIASPTIETAEVCMMLNAMRVYKELIELEDSSIESLIPLFLKNRLRSNSVAFHGKLRNQDYHAVLSNTVKAVSDFRKSSAMMFFGWGPSRSELKSMSAERPSSVAIHLSQANPEVVLDPVLTYVYEWELKKRDEPLPGVDFLEIESLNVGADWILEESGDPSANRIGPVKMRIDPNELNQLLDS